MDIYLLQDGQQVGPYSVEEIQSRIQSRKLLPEDLAWKEGLPEWVAVSTLVSTSPPPLPEEQHADISEDQSSEGTNWGQIIGGIVVLIFVGNFLIGKGCSSSDKPTRITEGSPSSAFERSKKDVDPKVELTDFSATWVTSARGFTAADGRLWVPQIKTTVKNNDSNDLDNYVLRAVFLDEKGVITSESKEWIRDLPAGYAKGPFFIKGSVGYTSDMPFVDMVKDDTKKWRYDLFFSTSYNGPWKKIKSDYVPLPTEYQRMFGQ